MVLDCASSDRPRATPSKGGRGRSAYCKAVIQVAVDKTLVGNIGLQNGSYQVSPFLRAVLATEVVGEIACLATLDEPLALLLQQVLVRDLVKGELVVCVGEAKRAEVRENSDDGLHPDNLVSSFASRDGGT